MASSDVLPSISERPASRLPIQRALAAPAELEESNSTPRASPYVPLKLLSPSPKWSAGPPASHPRGMRRGLHRSQWVGDNSILIEGLYHRAKGLQEQVKVRPCFQLSEASLVDAWEHGMGKTCSFHAAAPSWTPPLFPCHEVGVGAFRGSAGAASKPTGRPGTDALPSLRASGCSTKGKPLARPSARARCLAPSVLPLRRLDPADVCALRLSSTPCAFAKTEAIGAGGCCSQGPVAARNVQRKFLLCRVAPV